MDVSPVAPRSPWAFRILLVLLWLSLLPQVSALITISLNSADRFAENPWYFVKKGGPGTLVMIVVRGWLNWQFGRRRRWARLSLLWMHVAFAVFAGWSLYAVTQAVVFYPYYMMELLIYVICGCGLLIYLLARKDVAAWCRPVLSPPRTDS